MTDDDYHRAIRLLDLLCDADRLRLIGRLIEGNSTITELAAELSMKPQAVARHVRSLEDAGLLRKDAGDGTLEFDIASLRERLAELRPEAAEPFRDESDDDGRVLRAFVEGGRLVHLPTQRSRWQVVLSWLAGQFDVGREYPEPEVNEILGAIHEDHATLRRRLVDEGYMARERGVYWRVERDDPHVV